MAGNVPPYWQPPPHEQPVRALESTRTGAIFNDPWAAALAGPEGEAWSFLPRCLECLITGL